MRQVFFRVAMLAISFSLTLGIGECFVRLASPQPASWLAVYRSHPDLPFFSMLPNESLHVKTGETDWTVKTNANGFRVPVRDSLDSPDPECATLWLGDSFTLGHGVEYEESFVGQVAERTPSVHHINAAVAGYGPAEYRQTLEYHRKQGLPFDRIFVVSFVGNDFHDTQWDKNPVVEDGILGNQGGLKSFLKRNFHVYRLLTASYHALAGGGQLAHNAVGEQLAQPAAWQEEFLTKARARYAKEMRAIQDDANASGKEAVFLVIPTREAATAHYARVSGAGSTPPEALPPDGEGGVGQPMLPVENALGILGEIEVRALDLTPIVGAFPPAEMFFLFDGHLTPEANRLVAEEIVREFGVGCRKESSPEA